MELPAGAYPVPELWPDNQIWADAWHWLHARRPEGLSGLRRITDEAVVIYARRVGIDAGELALAMDAVDTVYQEWLDKQPKGK